jgi:hypothetical protein
VSTRTAWRCFATTTGRSLASHGWPDRLAIALEQSLVGGADRAGYCAEADISQATASADFRRLLDANFVLQQGRGRATRYQAADALRWAVKGSNLRP